MAKSENPAQLAREAKQRQIVKLGMCLGSAVRASKNPKRTPAQRVASKAKIAGLAVALALAKQELEWL